MGIVTKEKVDEHVIDAELLGGGEGRGRPVGNALVELGKDVVEGIFWAGGGAQVDAEVFTFCWEWSTSVHPILLNKR